MKDLFCPCIGLPSPRNSVGHEILRKQMEALNIQIDTSNIAFETGYDALSFPTNSANLSWWAHLCFIYFKRYFCNKHKPDQCPIRQAGLIEGSSCSRDSAINGGINNIIVEGMDRTGKSTLIKHLQKFGFKPLHHEYKVRKEGINKYYRSLPLVNAPQRIALDRSFLSEYVYGPIFRGKSRLSLNEIQQLLRYYGQYGTALIYLQAPKAILLKRLADKHSKDYIDKYYEPVNSQFETVISESSKLIPTYSFDTSIYSAENISYLISGIKI
jgi:thymidylate kinase